MKKILALLAPIVCLSLIPGAVKADTLTLVGATNDPAGGSVEIYPYTFNAGINGTSSTLNLMCLNFNREITVGETWGVSEVAVPTDSSQLSVDYRADALLYYLMLNPGISPTSYTPSEIQYADWSILDPAVSGNSLFDSASQSLAALALNYAANDTSLIGSGFYNQFTLYIPTDDTSSGPQEFIGSTSLTTSATPEPSSLALFGSGLVALAGLARRRFHRA